MTLMMTMTRYNGQSIIVQGSLVDKPNEPKRHSFQSQQFAMSSIECDFGQILLLVESSSPVEISFH